MFKLPKSFHVVIFVVLILSFVFLSIWNRGFDKIDVQLKGERLHLLHAETREERMKGLGGRETLGEFDGMLFTFTAPGRHAIVMRDMKFSIDIVWLHNGKVVDIAPSVPVEENQKTLHPYFPRTEANVVIELPAGWAAAHGLRIGDMVL